MNLPENLDRLKKLAETSPKAQFALAWFYLPDEQMNFVDDRYKEYQLSMLEGVSVENETIFFPLSGHDQHDLGQAFYWLKKSAECGFDEAYYPLASLYVDQENIVDAEKLAKQAENSGFKESALILGKINALKEQYKLAYEYYVKALNAGIQKAYGPMMKIVLKGYVSSDQANADIEKFNQFMMNRLEKNLTICYDNRFFGQELICAGRQQIDVPDDEEDDGQFEDSLKRIQEDYKWMADQLAEVGQLSVNRMRELQAKDRELEETMAMFAHKFRSPLDAIIYNTTHDNQPALYTEAAQTMRGLLDVFSIISTDETVLKERLKQDKQGSSNLVAVFGATLDMIMLHLLSVSGSERIQQHYMAYAKAHGLCDAGIRHKSWDEDFFELERKLRGEWQQAYAQLLNESADLAARLLWLEQHFFKLELTGFDHANIHFKEYGITASFLTILLNEILVNAFKYYSSTDKQPVTLQWLERDGYQVLSCRNPSTKSERVAQKGSGRGHTFLSALARKTGSVFSKPKPQDDFLLEFAIANELLISNKEGER